MIALASIRQCLDGATPAAIATCSQSGIPNVSYVSEVHYVDADHVALSYQFFNKTRANVLENARAEALVIDMSNGHQFSLTLRYLRTETSGPVFEAMRVKLAGIAAHTGMEAVFRLRGSDIYRVLGVRALQDEDLRRRAVASDTLNQVRNLSTQLVGCDRLEDLLDHALDGLRDELSISHTMIFVHDEPARRLYLIGSHGFAESGIGAEIGVGEGIVGLAASERTPIRLTHPAEGFRYGAAVRENVAQSGSGHGSPTAIPMPGLPAPGCQLAVPIQAGSRVFGVIYIESETDGAFTYETEDALVVVANQLALAFGHFDRQHEGRRVPEAAAAEPVNDRRATHVRYYGHDSSVFVDDEYLIKGVAGAILWKLLSVHAETGRCEFSNRELRLDRDIQLPGQSENLEARLVLLKRRLQERSPGITIVPVARGRFRLQVDRRLELECQDPR